MHPSLPAFALAACAITQTAAANEPPKLEAPKQEYVDAPKAAEGRHDGLDWQVNTGATFTINDNRSVVGQPDGSTFVFGFKLDGIANYNHADHEWRSTLTVGEGLARTPLVDELIKSRDALNVETIYLYHLVSWAGPFVRITLDTSMFRGADVRPSPVTYAIARQDGASDTRTASRLPLTDPFQPLMLKQSLGAFLQPIAKDEVSLEFRLGAGARETFAAGQLALGDDASTAEIEVKELADVHQVGAEATAQVWGALYEKRVLYRAGVELMTPLAYSQLQESDDRGALELTNISILGSLSFKLVSWASLDYELRAVRQPQLLEDFQVQNNLLLTFGISAGNLPQQGK